jgi:DNA-binding transcriptional ArsR family regulator
MLNAISPSRAPILDLVSLSGPTATFAQGAEAVLASPNVDMQCELDAYVEQHGGRIPPVLHGLADDLGVRRQMISSIQRYHDVAVGPRWSRIQTRLEADRHTRSQIMLDHGTDGLLTTLHPSLRWEPPFLVNLEKDRYRGQDLYLGGQGLLLVPSFFHRSPSFFLPADKRQQGMLIYPVELDAGVWADSPPGRALANLLGRTRATVLLAISDGTATTSQLASRTGTSAASISQHTAVLRDAGLITSHRYRNTVHHALATAGKVLLNGPA